MVSTVLTDVIAVTVVLGGMVLLHELGHFLAAKWLGVGVVTFSMGFGKRLCGYKHGGTDYRLSILPLGGYVKMAGDDPSAVLTGDRSEFLSRSRWERFFIVIMGPTMNFALAIVLLGVLYTFHFEKPAFEDQPVKIGAVDLQSAASQAGLQPGDLVVQFGDVQNPKWEDVEFAVGTGAGHPIPLVVSRNGQTLHTDLIPKAVGPSRTGDAGWFPYLPLEIEKITPGQPASQAGLKPGDTVLNFNGSPVYFWPLVVQKLGESKGQSVDLTVLRDGKEFHASMKPEYTDIMGIKTWRIGVLIRNNEFVVRKLPADLAFEYAVRDNYRNFVETFAALGKILSRRMSPKSLAGPIGIAQMTGEEYRRGITDLLKFSSYISLELGILNLLPIPILDGGVILLLLVEGFIRRDLSLEIKERFLQVGLVFLLLLMVFVVYNDIMKTLRPS